MKDIGSISIFKSKSEYNKLRKNISDNELILGMCNYFILVAVGAIPAMLALIDMIFPWPFSVYMSIKMQ